MNTYNYDSSTEIFKSYKMSILLHLLSDSPTENRHDETFHRRKLYILGVSSILVFMCLFLFLQESAR